MSRSRPNILVTGTPGVGKTKFSSALQSRLGLEVINVGQFAKDNNLLGEWDEQYQSHELMEDPLLDLLEERLGKGEGGVVVEHHVPEVRTMSGVIKILITTQKHEISQLHMILDLLLPSCFPSAGLTWCWF